MNFVGIISSCFHNRIVKKAVKKAVTDSVNVCLAENRGLGCCYSSVILEGCEFTLYNVGVPEDNYYVIVNHTALTYHFVKNNLIIFQGDYRATVDPLQTALHDFTSFGHLSKAIELAALGCWKECYKHIDDYAKDILEEITRMDIQCGASAHNLRLRFN